jgi:hypothetical protein
MFLNLLIDKLKWKFNVKGNSSVSLLLKDRPEIAEVLKGHDSLKRWMVEQFSGKNTKFPILWDPKEPEVSDIAEHSLPQRNEPAKIRVSRNMNGLDQLSGIIFELFNIRNQKKYNILWKKACKGEIGKQKYILRCFRLEYQALIKCKKFFKKNSLIYSTVENSKPNTPYKSIIFLKSFKYFAGFQTSRENYFAKEYEQRIAPYLLNKKKGK